MNNLAVTMTYEDVRLLLYSLCHKFRRRYGGDIEELFSEANEHYMAAYNTYNREKGTFSAWVGFRVWKCLLETVRSKMRRANNPNRPQQEDVYLEDIKSKEGFNIHSFMFDLSEDAAEVVKLTVESPQDIVFSIRALGGEKVPNIRKALIEYLKDLGWSFSRIKESFHEIGQALKEV